MWIILIKKLPTRPSPPKMSIFWSEPWPDDIYAPRQTSTCEQCGQLVRKDDGQGTKWKKKRYARHLEGYCECAGGPVFTSPEETYVFDSLGMKEPNWSGARRIHFAGHDIRVFPHEFNAITPPNMALYVIGDPPSGIEPSHALVAESASSKKMEKFVMNGDLRPIYDAALLDGCTPEQAFLTATEIDITAQIDFPPVGWYRCRREYAEIFCDDYEMEEHREPVAQ